ncbi:RNA polymerase sigma-70 factor [Pedobacter yulinensis]|uniref:RNA polymerase sigma-70 factor n=1 Tax=Pedobacter yulinensis TaxID=2126353 RepID=A0A2T3HMA4_9SPHI|nr:RNA polymerase sigma-70 factor [Pedobacter yulinensis]PST83564.1 RNA polymerase sigma-70 factor [Pedobacter yulinensis]
MQLTEQTLPATGHATRFEALFKQHFGELHEYAYSILRDWDLAEDVVASMFLRLWEKYNWEEEKGAIRAYLYRSVYHDSLNYIRDQKVKTRYQTRTAHAMKDETDNAAGKIELSQLEKRLAAALNTLPEKCRTVFQLSRYENLKYQEISAKLGISLKTVEAHMGKALKTLRFELQEYLPLFVILFLKLGWL